MGLKQGAIGNTHGEHIGNLLEQKKNEKNLPLLKPTFCNVAFDSNMCQVYSTKEKLKYNFW
jgi:hypothetical protein